ncbi:uncharacterized protein [Equus przewalskii]|uniref:Uncharacterized protein n=1 Tax=Equus przewalskii TaxID=9798 RepID=A0ABM4KWC5_EQUPR
MSVDEERFLLSPNLCCTEEGDWVYQNYASRQAARRTVTRFLPSGAGGGQRSTAQWTCSLPLPVLSLPRPSRLPRRRCGPRGSSSWARPQTLCLLRTLPGLVRRRSLETWNLRTYGLSLRKWPHNGWTREVSCLYRVFKLHALCLGCAGGR